MSGSYVFLISLNYFEIRLVYWLNWLEIIIALSINNCFVWNKIQASEKISKILQDNETTDGFKAYNYKLSCQQNEEIL